MALHKEEISLDQNVFIENLCGRKSCPVLKSKLKNTKYLLMRISVMISWTVKQMFQVKLNLAMLTSLS
jgi:hypothetical protein